jgi:putative transposase
MNRQRFDAGFMVEASPAGTAGFERSGCAQARWRAVNAPHLVALVRAGARLEKGKLIERPDESRGDQLVA